MTEDKKYVSEANARKKCFGFLTIGVLLVLAGLAAPAIFARFHLGSPALAQRLQWRLPISGITLSCASVYILYKFRRGYDRT